MKIMSCKPCANVWFYLQKLKCILKYMVCARVGTDEHIFAALYPILSCFDKSMIKYYKIYMS